MSDIRTVQAHTVKSASLRKDIEINYVNPIKPNSQNGISIFLKNCLYTFWKKEILWTANLY